MQVKKFQKKKEDFVCENCGKENIGDGFTNHCYKCFSSKHVDIFPGDRLEECHGLMPVVDYTVSGDKYVITHKCNKCGEESKDKIRPNDDFDSLLNLVGEINKLKEKDL